jgi:probable F420-dependent oxidoreductase
MDLTGIGIWSNQLRYGNPAKSADAAVELDELGFRALWIPDVGGAVFDAVGNLLTATKQTTVATGILNLWMHTPSDVAASYAELTATHGDRFLLGIGVSHAPVIDAGAPGRYRKPLAATASFLDELDATPQPVPVERRVLAALGPTKHTLSEPTGCVGIWPCRTTPTICSVPASPKTIWHR